MKRPTKFVKPTLLSTLLTIVVFASSQSFAFDFVVNLPVIAASVVNRGVEKTLIQDANKASVTVPATGSVEVAFSPNEGSQDLVVKVINSAKREINVLAYSFTSAPVTKALLNAKNRGVDVRVVADHESNVTDDKSGKARAALSALANAGVDVRTISTYQIHHDKVILVDGVTTQTGSYNFSASAANKNSENVLVNWNNPALAKVYLEHFQRNYRQATRFAGRY
jgi:phosphatidylserine/phosphatidylglycerophosphate/cardiolipin synthase-like enzyme